MKTRNLFLTVLTILAITLFVSCENSLPDPEEKDFGILPSKFKVDIPSSLSNNLKSATLKSTEADTVNGNIIYWYLNAYIAVGEGAADIVEAIMWSIRVHHIEDVITLTYTSHEDGRVKNLEVTADAEFEGRQWEYQMNITDAESEGNTDGGMAMQVFWSKYPVEGIAIIKPYNLNRTKNENAPEAIGKIVYSEKATEEYDAQMTVEMAGLPVERTFEVESMKMFVGKKGDLIDVTGNSNHPMGRFNKYDEKAGYDWAFVASGNDKSNVAVAEVGLPRNTENITGRNEILVDNSIKSVLTREMTNFVVAAYAESGITLIPGEIAALISPYLKNADAPGYFNSNGFVKGGTAPDEKYSVLEERIQQLTPFNPAVISTMTIEFKN